MISSTFFWFWRITPVSALLIALVLPAGLGADPFRLPSGNFITRDGRGYLAIRPGGHVYVRQEGEDRFTLYRVDVFARVRNEFWTRRRGAAARTAPVAKTDAVAKTESPPESAAQVEEPSLWQRLLAKFKKSDEAAGAAAEPVEPPEAQDEVEAKLATAWFSDSTRLVFVFEGPELSVLVFRDGILRGTPVFRAIKVRLAVPDHARP